ncbi:LuxR C-terminal-related transcriptional regulator [Pedobacter sp. Leaf132]|uniref:LuxR C-terminal-related transcriptional regulator n=1 Tax=Pedobacter sp. Leaf132 TaxID=2876557 RepID=UPI001E49720F|nr:LuxR C-terminal-related transcriptional regulator [Pedobacter sp. Leaf132]
MNKLNDLSANELYRIAGYANQLQQSSKSVEFIPEIVTHQSESCIGYQGVFNWSCMQYLSISNSIKTILGYEPEIFIKKGLNFSLSIIHPVDLDRVRAVHQSIFEYYYKTPKSQRPKLRFGYNLRVRTKNQDYIHILRQSNFISFTDDGKPVIEYINCTDITGFSFNNVICLTVHLLSPSGTFELSHEQEFPEIDSNLSKREKEVLELASQGYTSKQIAAKLYLCTETIKSHRKHIIAKTGVGNMAAAINKIIRH